MSGQQTRSGFAEILPAFPVLFQDPHARHRHLCVALLAGQLTMEDQRDFANIELRLEPGRDGQQLQQFMSDSPWSARLVYERIQDDIKEDARFQHGGVLFVDETADAKAREGSAGAARQHTGRLGKVVLCQVATSLSFVPPASGVWNLVDDELFLPEHWFNPEYAELRQEVGALA
jgi:SRSO17 transposase